jgi:hypothetical protein
MVEYLAGTALVIVAVAYALRFAYKTGRTDRRVEKELREENQTQFAAILARLHLLETEDATRRRQLHDLIEEFESVIGPTHRDRVARLLQETSATRNAQPQSQRERYGLGNKSDA